MAGHFIDPQLGNQQPNFSGMGLTAAEQRALGTDIDPSNTLTEYQQHSQQQNAAMERYEFERMQRESDSLRVQLEQTTQALNQVQADSAHVRGQLDALYQTQNHNQQQAALDAATALSQEEMDEFGQLLPVVEKTVRRSLAEQERDLREEFDQKVARIKAETEAPLRAQIDQLSQTTQQVQAQTQQRLAAELNREIASMGMGDINTLTAHPEFQQWHSMPAYPGAVVANGAELKRHIEDGNTSSAIAMLRSFQSQSNAFQVRDDTVVPTGRSPALRSPMTSQQTANLTKRDQLLARYQENMENANNNIFPRGVTTRAQYKALQAQIQREIDAIPTT